MTAATQFGLYSRWREFQMRWLMWLVTTQTVLVDHLVGVTAVALKALLILSVLLVTFVAIHLGVGTGVFLHGVTRISVTGKTHRFDRRGRAQVNLQRFMGIVAAGAVFNFIVRTVTGCVTIGAGGDDSAAGRWMVLVTITTVDLCRVCATLAG